MKRSLTLAMGILMTLPIAQAAAAHIECTAISGHSTVALLELYTSEGCSSCPPADRWFAELAQEKFGPDRLIRLAFHVDYWNDLGWRDPFSQSGFSQRQREIAQRAGARTIYTPEFVLNGKEYRRGFSNSIGDDVSQINQRSAQAALTLTLTLARNNSSLHVTGSASLVSAVLEPTQLFIAVVENNLENHVRAGENEGRTLHHDAVVRRLAPPLKLNFSETLRVDQHVLLDKTWKTNDLSVVAFVQSTRNNEVLQAIALPLCH